MAEKKLKTNITADTSQFKKEMKDARTALKDFEKEGNGALSGIASMFGVSSTAIEGVVKNLGQASSAMKLLGSTGESSTAAMTAGMKALGASIAGLGIMAAVAAFKQLNAEASNFEQRLQGVNLAASAQAYRDTYTQALYDAGGAGKGWANFMERSKTYFSTQFAEIGTMFSTNASDRAQAASTAERAAQLASDMVELKREERALSIEIQGINNKIYEAQNKFRDSSASVAERKQAEATITELISDKYAKQADLQGRMLANVKERNSLVSSTEAELDEEANLEKGILSLQGQQQQELNSMLRMHNSINKAASGTATSAKEEAEATVLTLEAATKLVEKQRELKAIQDQNNAAMAAARFRLDGGSLPSLSGAGLQGQAVALTTTGLIKTEVDEESLQAAVIKWSELVEQGVTGASEALGTLIGNLINGEDAWGNFAQAGIDVIADMLSTVGRAFVATGSGVIAAESALSSGNGYAAIAAGAAMIALAATMKTVMSNAAANWGGGGYSTSVASSAYTSGAYGASSFGREMNVKVTGTLTANGSQLVAVLNNENDRKNYTT